LTRDNLSIRKKLDDMTCLFCSENESVQHLFFECVVAKQMWVYLSEACDRDVGQGFFVNRIDVVK